MQYRVPGGLTKKTPSPFLSFSLFSGPVIQCKQCKLKTDIYSEQLTPWLRLYQSVSDTKYMSERKEVKFCSNSSQRNRSCHILA